MRPEARRDVVQDNSNTSNTNVDYWLIGLLVIMSVIVGSLVDDVIRIGFNKLRGK